MPFHPFSILLALLLVVGGSLRAQQVGTPTFTPTGGSEIPVDASIETTTPGATIHYTLDGSLPDQSDGVYSAPLAIATHLALRARAYKVGLDPSDIATAIYRPAQVPLPSFTYTREVLNDNSAVPTISLALTAPPEVRSWAIEEHLLPGLIPTNISNQGIYHTTLNLIRWGPFDDLAAQNLSYDLSGPAGSYSLSGLAWLDGRWQVAPADLPVLISGGFTGVPDQVAPPTFTTDPDPFVGLPTQVTIETSTAGASIYYTTDGTTPTESSTPYLAPLDLVSETLIRARAFKPGSLPSPARSALFADPALIPVPALVHALDETLPDQPLVSTTLTPAVETDSYAYLEELPRDTLPTGITENGLYDPARRTIKWGPFDDNTARTFSYRLTGPTASYSVTGQWSVNGFGGFESPARVVPIDNGGISLPPTDKVAPPVFTTDPDPFVNLPTQLTISTATTGASIHYTTDGTIPSPASPQYTTPLNLSSHTTVIAKAFKTGLLPSAHRLGIFTDNPEIDNSLDVVRSVTDDASAVPLITLTATPIGSPSHFTVVENIPPSTEVIDSSHNAEVNPTTRTIKWGPFDDGASRSLSYRLSGQSGTFGLDGAGSSDGRPVPTTGTNQATIQLAAAQKVALPVISPLPDGFFPVTVSITGPTTGAEIRFTTDGSPPDLTSPIYTSPFDVTTITLVQAKGYKQFLRPSDVAQQYYGEEQLPTGSTITRRILFGGTSQPQVQLLSTPGTNVACYAVEEIISQEVMPSSISHGGHFNSASRTIKWGPFLDDAPRTVTYLATGQSGIHPAAGSASFNGFTTQTDGETEVWIGNAGIATTTISNNYTALPTVTLDFAPSAGISCYSVEATVPPSVTPDSISDDGLYNPANNKIKWGPFLDSSSRAFSYNAVGDYQQYETEYRISVDGFSMNAFGQMVGLRLPPPQDIVITPGNEALFVTWSGVPNSSGYQLYWWPTGNQGAETQVTIASPDQLFHALRNLQNNQSYTLQMTAFDANGDESGRSSEITASPLPTGGDWATLTFDLPHYPNVTDTPVITLIDDDLNTNDLIAENASLVLITDTDQTGIMVTLTETGLDTATFTATVSLSFDLSDEPSNTIQITEGDELTASYEDIVPLGSRIATATFSEFDGDGDGLPDSWERINFGSLAATNGLLDSDQDGDTDTDEWIKGTDPNDRNSRQSLWLDFSGSQNPTLFWNSTEGRTYTIWKLVDSDSGFYILLENIPTTPPLNSYTDVFDPGQSAVLYRIETKYP